YEYFPSTQILVDKVKIKDSSLAIGQEEYVRYAFLVDMLTRCFKVDENTLKEKGIYLNADKYLEIPYSQSLNLQVFGIKLEYILVRVFDIDLSKEENVINRVRQCYADRK